MQGNMDGAIKDGFNLDVWAISWWSCTCMLKLWFEHHCGLRSNL
ncbi:hypothetical protein A2U01_0057723, partial [Trifolium medium]|nr:hypothetical protein [Trifolium medium]